MENALLEMERKIEIECSSIISFQLRSNLTAAFQNKVCSNNVFDRNDSLVTDFSGYSIAEMVCILLWIQSKKIKLRHTERGRSTYFPTWSQEPIEANLQAERARDPCPLLITLANGSRYSHISHYNGHQPQPGNCRLRKFHPRNEVTFCYWRPNQVNQRMTLVEFNSEWYRLHLAMEIVRRKGATMQVTDPFIDLPVAVGIVMATQLIRKDYDNITINESVLHEFVYNTGPATYHIFSSDRVIKFNILTQRLVCSL